MTGGAPDDIASGRGFTPARARIRIGEVVGGSHDGTRAVVVTVHDKPGSQDVTTVLTFSADEAREFAAGMIRGAEEMERREAAGGGGGARGRG